MAQARVAKSETKPTSSYFALEKLLTEGNECCTITTEPNLSYSSQNSLFYQCVLGAVPPQTQPQPKHQR